VTYTSSHAIVALLADKKRVGVAFNSHKAINNLLKDVEAVAREKGVCFSGIKGSSKEEQYFRGTMIADTDNSGAASYIRLEMFHNGRYTKGASVAP
jgi:hypothetical protein